jgi:hypothetical protein
MRRNVIVLMVVGAIGISSFLASACKARCAEDCEKTRNEALAICDGDACERAKTNYDACIRVCDGKHDDIKR